MRLVAIFLLSIAAVCSVHSALAPLTAKEISLMLRSGCTSDSVRHELTTRHFSDAFDSTVEQQLIRAGASQVLLDELRSGVYQLSPSETAQVKAAELVREKNKAERNPGGDEQISQVNQSKDPAESSVRMQAGGSIYDHLRGDLVRCRGGSVTPFEDGEIEQKKLYLFFFSANWSAAGRKFTSQLVDYYNRTLPQHPEFEVIFCSMDRSQFGMETYMMQSAMPWPAIAFDKRGGKAGDMEKNLVREVPSLVLCEASGKILSSSHSGENAVTPEQVLTDLDGILRNPGTVPDRDK